MIASIAHVSTRLQWYNVWSAIGDSISAPSWREIYIEMGILGALGQAAAIDGPEMAPMTAANDCLDDD